MKDIIEQLEEGKKAQENGTIDKESIYTKLNDNETVNREGEVIPEQNGFDLFKEAEQIIKDSTNVHEETESPDVVESSITKSIANVLPRDKVLENPEFDFNDDYEVNQTIYFLRVFYKLGTKELLTLKIRSIYTRMIVGSGKNGCLPIGYDAKDMIYTDMKVAREALDNIHVQEIVYSTDVKLKSKDIDETESEDYLGNERDDDSIEKEEENENE